MGKLTLLYLTTVGARTQQQRTTAVARFDDGTGGWYVVASAGGAAQNPGWYHNIAAHPDQVWVEVAGRKQRVTADQLSGEERARVWAQIVSSGPQFAAYVEKTDREIPVLRLTPAA